MSAVPVCQANELVVAYQVALVNVLSSAHWGLLVISRYVSVKYESRYYEIVNGEMRNLRYTTTSSVKIPFAEDPIICDKRDVAVVWHYLDSRGLGKPGRLGDKPDGPDGPPSTSPGRIGSDRPGGDAPGGGVKAPDKPPVFTDTNLENARLKGEGLQRDLDLAVFDGKPDGGNKIPLEESGYAVNRQPEKPSDEKYLDEFPINYKKDWAATTVSKENSGTIVKTIQDSDQGVIAVKESWNKKKDPNGIGWTTMVMDNWRTTAGTPEKVQALKYMVRDNIQTIDTFDRNGLKLNTVNAIRTSFEKMQKDKKETLALDPKSTNPDEVATFQLMAAQTHVARPLQLLKDYHNELGNLRIVKLYLQTDQHRSRSYQWNIIIEFGK
ncbi:hypothetical protein FHL15_005733 [Xylaria flabelliformis]|uniref:Uncharacterized protein n=1 Tax=Xylaria flabelliformis TaxID=2512241 RepID=A0A553HZS7_9PEZI|nr:hypothetical protein FHL15_005733 [Xylaria flabelliformis]